MNTVETSQAPHWLLATLEAAGLRCVQMEATSRSVSTGSPSSKMKARGRFGPSAWRTWWISACTESGSDSMNACSVMASSGIGRGRLARPVGDCSTTTRRPGGERRKAPDVPVLPGERRWGAGCREVIRLSHLIRYWFIAPVRPPTTTNGTALTGRTQLSP
jgi:hypothetical protein